MANADTLKTVNGRLAKGEGWIGYRNASTTPSKYLYFAFYRDNKQVFVNTKTNDAEEAYRQLLDARGATQRGVVVLPSEAGRISYEHLRDSYLNGSQSPTTKLKLPHLDKFFSKMKVTAITTDVLRQYIAARGRKVAGPTIRRELTILRAMFNDAIKSKKVSRDQMPWFPMPKDSEAAGSYIYPADFGNILGALPTKVMIEKLNAKVRRGAGRRNGELLRGRIREFHELRPFFRFLYGTGCRKGTAASITWKQVRKNERNEFVIDLPSVKGGRQIALTMTGDFLKPVAEHLGSQFQVQSGFVFDSTNHVAEWNKACAKAGVRGFDVETRKRSKATGGRLHDCRCSGAVNLLRAGLDEGTVLKIGGWKTRAMLDRYNVMDEFRIAEGLRRGGEFVVEEMQKAKVK